MSKLASLASNQADQNLFSYDICVIGSGPGGYVAAIKAAQKSYKVAIIEKRAGGDLGGTCLNVGCIPSKSLLDSAYKYYQFSKCSDYGIDIDPANISLNFNKVLQNMNKVVAKQRNGLKYLMKKNNIDIFLGHGQLSEDGIKKSPFKVNIKDDKSKNINSLMSKNIIIATGSCVNQIKAAKIDGKLIHDSDSIFSIKSLPASVVILGGGVIGMEWASMFAMFGSKVIVLDSAEHVLGGFDRDCVNHLSKKLKSLGVEIHTCSTILSSHTTHNTVIVKYQKDNQIKTIKSAMVFLAVGRRANSRGLNLADYAVKTDAKGFIEVDENYQTKSKNIFAIGDVINTPALAHTASKEAEFLIDYISSISNHNSLKAQKLAFNHNSQKIDYKLNPMALYTQPQIAYVGANLNDLIANKNCKHVKYSLKTLAKAQITDDDGFIKLYYDLTSKEILAVHIVANYATEMISEFVFAMQMECTLEEFSEVIRAHPTVSETFTESALLALGSPIHM